MYSFERDPYFIYILEQFRLFRDNDISLIEMGIFIKKIPSLILEINKLKQLEYNMILFSKSKLKQELIEYVFKPTRIEKLAKLYNIPIWDFIENY